MWLFDGDLHVYLSDAINNVARNSYTLSAITEHRRSPQGGGAGEGGIKALTLDT